MSDRQPLSRLLVANRGEIAVRVLRAAADLGIETVAVHTTDEPDAPHAELADQRIVLPGTGAAAYLDADGLLDAARRGGADAVHPGYGFLSENADFAQACADADLRFIGPPPELLRTFGDKTSARALAVELGLPVLAATDVAQAANFLDSLGPGGAVMVKALTGGGGRGMRPVFSAEDLPEAIRRCRSEARQAFGDDRVHVERLLPRAHHVEVQIVGDGSGAVAHLGERDCSVQRRRQKMIEIAPSPWLSDEVRDRLFDAAVTLGGAMRYRGVGTVEFLVDSDEIAFLEVNPRLQVEHTVTEEVTGIDLVTTALEIATGATLADLGLDRPIALRGVSLQARVNTETLLADGSVRPTVGTLSRFTPPAGRGIRVDTHGVPGYAVGPQFDPLLAKVVVTEPGGDLARLLRRAERALGEFVVEGPSTTIPVLRRLLTHPDLHDGQAHTRFVEDVLPDLLDEGEPTDASKPDADTEKIVAPLAGVIVDVEAAEGDAVSAGRPLLIIESMKMEHVVAATCDGVLGPVGVSIGDVVSEGTVLALFTEGASDGGQVDAVEEADPDHIRPDLAEALARQRVGSDEARPAAVQRRRRTRHRTARENIDDLCDAGSFVEYGALTVAAQRQRRSMAELIEQTPGDGIVTGIGSVDGVRCVVMSYDYTVLAGTQGLQNHRKTDRMLDLAERGELPLVLFAEGGGGRPGDTDTAGVAGLDVPTFHSFARLSGSVPLVGIVSGRCFAGNAALAGCCDVVISTEDASLGMGGPAMIEGGGLGVVAADDVGPMSSQVPNGVVDVLVPDEAAAVRTAKRYLRYLRDPASVPPATSGAADQRAMRHLVPENRLRVYDVRTVIDTLADAESVLELRPRFGIGIITALAEIGGRPVGVIANDPRHLGGAIDSPASDKAARFLQLCDAFALPVVSLCDTPGFMVGPESERTATVRHFSRMFVAGANLSVPVFLVVLRKAYGLGAMAMSGGSLKIPFAAASWPSGEFGGMGLEGAVDLGYRKELAAITDPDARRERRTELIAALYAKGKGLNAAASFEIDDVIDPADTRAYLISGLTTAPRRTGPRRTFVDAW